MKPIFVFLLESPSFCLVFQAMNMLDTFFSVPWTILNGSWKKWANGQRPSWGLCVMPIRNPLGVASPHPSAKWFRPKLLAIWTPFWWRKKKTSWEWLLFSMLSMETNLSSKCWGWMDHFFGGLLFLWDLQPFPFATDRLSFCLTAFSWGPSGSLGKVGNTMSFKSPTKAWHKNFHTKVVTPSIIIPAKNYCVQFPCQHASFHAIFSADPKNSQRLLPKWGCFSGCSFFVWWSGFHWQKRMLGFPRKKLAIYRGVGGLQDHTLQLWYG